MPRAGGANVADLLAAAVAGIGGSERPGQVVMAQAVAQAIDTGEHLAVQAGTGTGKSLAYLVPAIAHARASGDTVVVATATIALQSQLIDRDLPRIAAALTPGLGRPPTFAILKGRRNYLCLHRLREGAPAEPGDMLFDPGATSDVGKQVQRITEWANQTRTGDRDELVPGVEDRAWRQVAVTARECLGAQRCPHASSCFAEQAREQAGSVDIVVTNHALLAIDALEEYAVLPEHQVVIIDEAHDLVNRVTSAAAAELSTAAPETAARRATRQMSAEALARLREAGAGLDRAYAEVGGGRLDVLSEPLATALAALRDAASAGSTEIRGTAKEMSEDTERLAAGRAATAALDELAITAQRILVSFEPDIASRSDVVWMERPFGDEPGRPPALHVAPLEVGGLLAERLFGRRTVILTSATLVLGGSFEPMGRQWGLPPPADPGGGSGAAGDNGDSAGVRDDAASRGGAGGESGADGESGAGDEGQTAGAGRSADGQTGSGSLAWTGLDVGSPFDHPRSAILYVAKHLPPPGRDGLADAYLTELRELIDAAGGRTLGLFSSMRAARQAADALRDQVSCPLLCQGEDSTAALVRAFTEDEQACLFGTLSLWQGVDVPGRSLQLVVIDRIPFPRPDDPLASARQRAVAARGGNGFMAVAATHAALLLAQGAGRLLRTVEDRGMVAVLDPRLATARYGGFLRASLPPFWTTTDPELARAALRRLAAG